MNPDALRVKITWANVTDLQDDYMTIQLAFTRPEIVSYFYKEVSPMKYLCYRIKSQT